MAGIYRRSTLSAAPMQNIGLAPTGAGRESNGAPTSSSSSSPTTRSKHAAASAPSTRPASSSSSSPIISASNARRSSRSRTNQREQRDLAGRWLADDFCSHCGGPAQESRLYCSEECLRKDTEVTHRRESDQLAQAMAEVRFVQTTDAFQAMADVDIADDHFDFAQQQQQQQQQRKVQRQKHRHSLPMPYAQPLNAASHLQSSPTESLPPLSSISQAARSDMIRALLRDEFKHLDDAEATNLLRKLGAIPYIPRPPASDASSSSLASLPPPGTHHRLSTPNLPPTRAHDSRAPPSYRSSSTSSISSGQQRNNSSSGIFAHPHRSRSRSSTMSETTSTSDDAYTTGPGTPSPAIKADSSHGYPDVIHEGDSEPSLLSLPPSISSPSAVLLPSKSPAKSANGAGPMHLRQQAQAQKDFEQRTAHFVALSAALSANSGANHLSSTYTAHHRSPVMYPTQYQQATAAAAAAAHSRNGSRSQPGTPWRNSVALPADPMRRSPALMPVLSPAAPPLRFARRPSSTAMPRSAVSAAIAAAGITSAAIAAAGITSAAPPHNNGNGNGSGYPLLLHQMDSSSHGPHLHHHSISVLSSPVLTPTSGGTASTTPTASVGHVSGLTSSSMPHALSFFRPQQRGTTSPAVGPTTTTRVGGQLSSQQQQQQNPGTAAPTMVRRPTRERVGFMTPVLPPTTGLTLPGGMYAKWPSSTTTTTTSTGVAPTATSSTKESATAPTRPVTRSRSHTTTASTTVSIPAFVAASSDSASDFARSTSEEESEELEDVPSDLELECQRGCRCHQQPHQHHEVEVRGRSQVSIASTALGSGSGTAGSRCSPATARSSVTAIPTGTGRPAATSDQARGRSRAQGDRSSSRRGPSSRRGRSPPRGAARTETSLTRLSSAAETATMRTGRAASVAAVQDDSAPRRVSPVNDRRGRSPTVPLLVAAAALSTSSACSPKLSPCTAAPQVLHPHHALFGAAPVHDEDDGGQLMKRGGREEEETLSSWERASPLAKLARWQDEARRGGRGRGGVAAEEDNDNHEREEEMEEDMEGEGDRQQARGRGRAAGRNGSSSRSRGRRERVGAEVVVQPMSRAVRSDDGASRVSAKAAKVLAPVSAPVQAARSPARARLDPGFDDVDLEIELEC